MNNLDAMNTIHVLPGAVTESVLAQLLHGFHAVAGRTVPTLNLGSRRVRADVPLFDDLRDQATAAVRTVAPPGTSVEFTAVAHVYTSQPRCGTVTTHTDQPYTLGPVEHPVRPGAPHAIASLPASTHTLLLYCTTCEGGATWLQTDEGGSGAALPMRVRPVAGTGVLFAHGVVHGADDVDAGVKTVAVMRVRLHCPKMSGP
jgi:hypothetical protein